MRKETGRKLYIITNMNRRTICLFSRFFIN